MLLILLFSVNHLTKIYIFYCDYNIINKKNDICCEQMPFYHFTPTLLLTVGFE